TRARAPRPPPLAGDAGHRPAADRRAGRVTPEVRYARNGRVAIAYQVAGDGPVDLVVAPGCASQLDALWDEPRLAAFLERLAARSRMILYDAREQGLSD